MDSAQPPPPDLREELLAAGVDRDVVDDLIWRMDHGSQKARVRENVQRILSGNTSPREIDRRRQEALYGG